MSCACTVRQNRENLLWTMIAEGLESRTWMVGSGLISGFPPSASSLGNFLHVMQTVDEVHQRLRGKPQYVGVQSVVSRAPCRSGEWELDKRLSHFQRYKQRTSNWGTEGIASQSRRRLQWGRRICGRDYLLCFFSV